MVHFYEFLSWLRQEIDKTGLSMSSFAERSGIKQSSLALLFSKGDVMPTIETAYLIIAGLNRLGCNNYAINEITDRLMQAEPGLMAVLLSATDESHCFDASNLVVNETGLKRYRAILEKVIKKKGVAILALPPPHQELLHFVASGRKDPTLDDMRGFLSLGPHKIKNRCLSLSDLVRLVFGDGKTIYD